MNSENFKKNSTTMKFLNRRENYFLKDLSNTQLQYLSHNIQFYSRKEKI